MSFYLDASFLVSMVVEEASTPLAERWWRGQGGRASFVGGFAAAEVAATISRGLRARRFTAPQAADALADFDALRALCEVFAPTPRIFDRAEALVRDFSLKLAAPDALHLAGAIEAGLALVTFDRRLADAARLVGVEAVFP